MPNSELGLALREDEIQRIADHLGRQPSVVELHAFDAQWSEHCSYKSSRHHLKNLPTKGANVIVGVGEDAGIVHLGEHEGASYGIVVAHESHNHPSQVVPFEGAATGVGGIVRDVLCMGAEVIGIADALRFGDPRPESHQAYVARTVVDGVGAYGNAIGVPNITGDVAFHSGFDDNCLVNVIALGIVNEEEIIHSRAPEGADGWDVVLVGKATDPSGFGGASFSSVTLDSADEDANKGAVQVPDPFLKNVIMRASYRAFEFLRGRLAEMQKSGETIGGKVPERITDICGFKDLGAGGIMGCSAEICSAGGFGAEIDLSAVNVAVADLAPQVIAIGETQERLIWTLPPSITPEIVRIYNEEFTLPQIAFNARAVVIGKVSAQGRYVLRHNGAVVMDVDIDFLIGSIKDELPYTQRSTSNHVKHRTHAAELKTVEELEALLGTIDLGCREPLYRHYDSVVRGATVIPRGYADAGVFAALPGSRLGVALGVAGDPVLGERDAYTAAQVAVEEAVARVIAVGAKPLALTDCLNFGNPQRIEHYSDLVAAIGGLGDAANAYALPFISGNVSLYNESKNGNAIPASAIVACLGGLADIERVITPGSKHPGAALHALSLSPKNADALLRAIERGDVSACTVIDMHGLEIAAVRMLFAAQRAGRTCGIGLKQAWSGLGWLVEVRAGMTLGEFGEIVGTTISEPTIGLGATIVPLERLQRAWAMPLEELYP